MKRFFSLSSMLLFCFSIIAMDLVKEIKLKSQVQGPCRTGPFIQVENYWWCWRPENQWSWPPSRQPIRKFKDIWLLLFFILNPPSASSEPTVTDSLVNGKDQGQSGNLIHKQNVSARAIDSVRKGWAITVKWWKSSNFRLKKSPVRYEYFPLCWI